MIEFFNRLMPQEIQMAHEPTSDNYFTTINHNLTTSVASTNFDFGVKDRFGRVVGSWIKIDLVTFDEVAEPKQWYCYSHLKPGTYYRLDAQATRDGEKYGASQPRKYFKTLPEALACQAKYLAGASKRALKQFAKPEA